MGGTRQLELAASVQAELLAAGIRTLPLKGAALVGLVYDSASDRPMDDVDLLCIEDGAARAGAFLVQHGWRAGAVADHAVAFEGPAGGWMELHHALASCPALHPFDREAWWARRRSGAALVTPSAADILLQAGVHAAFQHGLALKLIQYVDLRRLAALPGLEVVAPGTDRDALALALHQAEALVGGIPEALLAKLPLPSHLRRVVSATLPSPRQVPRVRWALARGRRLTLLRQTLWPAQVGWASAPSRLARLAGRMR